MTLKEAKKEALNWIRNGTCAYCYLSISKQTEIGWYPEKTATQRSVFFVTKDGSLELLNTDFARNYKRQYFPNVRCKQ